MKDLRKQQGQDCHKTENPAPQPVSPPTEPHCEEWEVPVIKDFPMPEGCWELPCNCQCPTKPGDTSNCLEELITDQAAEIVKADKAKVTKADLEKLLESSNKSAQVYTRARYDELREKWRCQDRKIAELLRRIDCDIHCWKCVIECHVCPILHELYVSEQALYGNEKPITEINSLYDQHYLLTRHRAARERGFQRIDSVLKVWANSVKTIDKTIDDVLAANAKIYETASAAPIKPIYDVFLRLVPLHLAIAPPAGVDPVNNIDYTTAIDVRYTQFCECKQKDNGKKCDNEGPDNCCGPDLGPWGLRQRLVGIQPYLIDPNDYFKVICCLLKNRYVPAKNALAEADVKLAEIKTKIDRYEANFKFDSKLGLEAWAGTFEARAKANIPALIKCCSYESEDSPRQTTF